jgi:UDP-N-acetylglucosamine acyltransferase
MAMLGAGAIVVKDVPPFCTVQGDRARLKGLNIIALKRKGCSEEALRALRSAYRILFREGYTFQKALEHLKNSVTLTAEVEQLVEFLSLSKRGFTR